MPAIGPFFTGAKQLSIDLTEPVVYLRGYSGDRTTHVIQGEVSVVLTKPIVATQVVIRFVGKSHILWPEGVGPRGNIVYHEKVIHEQNIILQSFLPHTEGTLPVGLHRWPFQFLISNQLVETIEDECGKVSYSMIATVHRVGVAATKLRARRDILLLRTPHWSDSALTSNTLPSTSILSERKLDLCDASILIEKSSCSSGTQLPITLCLSPNVKQVFLESLSVVLTERRVYKLPEYQARRVEHHDFKLVLASVSSLVDPTLFQHQQLMSSKEMHKSLVVRQAHIPLDASFRHRLIYNMPNCVNLNHSSTFSEIYIQHSLKIQIEVSLGDEVRTIMLDTPMTVLDCRLKADYNILPTYEESLLCSAVEQEQEKDTTFLLCPCYIEYKKTNKCSQRDWMKLRSHSSPPPSYNTL
ncbi:hypothetical protein CU098_010365 [Rhizopus stolonifer]|uniref:Arrestin-like N-terminal domain-containing protein n=1 Tax=Rhizopus stolonifer TaxID=4846 RepID=A0A367KVA3_RHIST|nr:hypothetical protein CU098_010365 [Rhizopus stolonifer]